MLPTQSWHGKYKSAKSGLSRAKGGSFLGTKVCACAVCNKSKLPSSPVRPCWDDTPEEQAKGKGKGKGKGAKAAADPPKKASLSSAQLVHFLLQHSVQNNDPKMRSIGIKAFNALTLDEHPQGLSDIQHLCKMGVEEVKGLLDQRTQSSPLAADLLRLMSLLKVILWKFDDSLINHAIQVDQLRSRREFQSPNSPIDVVKGSSDWNTADSFLQEAFMELLVYLLAPVASDQDRHLKYLCTINGALNSKWVTMFYKPGSKGDTWLQAYFVNFRSIFKMAWDKGVDKYTGAKFVYPSLNGANGMLELSCAFLEPVPKKLSCDFCRKRLPVTCSKYLYPPEFHFSLDNYFPRTIPKLDRGPNPEKWTGFIGHNFDKGEGNRRRSFAVACQQLCVLENERPSNELVNMFMTNLRTMTVFEKLTVDCKTKVDKSELKNLDGMVFELRDDREVMLLAASFLSEVKEIPVLDATRSLMNLYYNEACSLKQEVLKEETNVDSSSASTFTSTSSTSTSSSSSKSKNKGSKAVPEFRTCCTKLNMYRFAMAKALKKQRPANLITVERQVRMSLFSWNWTKSGFGSGDGSGPQETHFDFQVVVSDKLHPYQPRDFADSTFAGIQMPFSLPTKTVAIPVENAFFSLYQHMSGVKFVALPIPRQDDIALLDKVLGKDNEKCILFVNSFDLENKSCDGGFLYRDGDSPYVVGIIVMDLFEMLTDNFEAEELITAFNYWNKEDSKLTSLRAAIHIPKTVTSRAEEDEETLAIRQQLRLIRLLAQRSFKENLSTAAKSMRWPHPIQFIKVIMVCQLPNADKEMSNISCTYIVFKNEPPRATFERFFNSFKAFPDPLKNFALFQYSTTANDNVRFEDHDVPISHIDSNKSKLKITSEGYMGVAMFNATLKADIEENEELNKTRLVWKPKEGEKGSLRFNHGPVFCKLTVRVEIEDTIKDTESFFVLREEPLKQLLYEVFGRYMTKESVKVVAIEDPTTSYENIQEIRDLDDTPSHICSEMGLDPKELTLLLTDDPVYVEQRTFDPNNQLLSFEQATKMHWGREDYHDALHFCKKSHPLVWKGTLKLHGEEDLYLGVALGQCSTNVDEAISGSLKLGQQLDAYPIRGLKRDLFGEDLIYSEISKQFSLVLCGLVGSKEHPFTPNNGDIVRELARACKPTVEPSGETLHCLVPILKGNEERFMLLRMITLHESGEEKESVVLQLVYVDRLVIPESLVKYDWQKLKKQQLLYETDIVKKHPQFLLGLMTTTFYLEAFSFAVFSKSAINLHKFFADCDPAMPSHKLRALPWNFPFAKKDKWSQASRIVSVSSIDVKEPTEFISLFGDPSKKKARPFLVTKKIKGKGDHDSDLMSAENLPVFLIMIGTGKDFEGYFPNVNERREIVEHLRVNGPHSKSDLKCLQRWEKSVTREEWNVVRQAAGFKPILSQEEKLEKGKKRKTLIATPGTTLKIQKTQITASRAMEKLRQLRANIAEEALQDSDYLAPALCEFCRKEQYNMRACSKCLVTYYCSSNCQNKNQSNHIKDCSKFVENRARDAAKLLAALAMTEKNSAYHNPDSKSRVRKDAYSDGEE